MMTIKGDMQMGKERKMGREDKKKAQLTHKEKRALKKTKKQGTAIVSDLNH